MRFQPAALSGDQIPIAQMGEIGVESQVFVSPTPLVKLGTVNVNSAGTASFTAVSGVTIPVAGYDLHLRAETPMAGLAALPSVTLSVKVFGGATTTAVAAFAVPTWVADQSKKWPYAASIDFIPQGGGNSDLTVIELTGLSTTANLPANSTFTIWGSVAAANFIEIGFKRNASGAYGVPQPVSIASGYNPAANVKPGRAEIPSLDLEFVHVSSWDGLTAYNGRRVAVAIKTVKNKLVNTGWDVYNGYLPNSSPNRGDGNDEVLASSSGAYEDALLFSAT